MADTLVALCFSRLFKPGERFFQVLFGWEMGELGGLGTSFILWPCTRNWSLLCFRLFVQHTAQGCGTRHVVTSVHAFGDQARNTGMGTVFASLYDILHKDMEQGKLSQASMPLATTAFLFLDGLWVADSGLTHSISEQSQKPKHNVTKTEVFSLTL